MIDRTTLLQRLFRLRSKKVRAAVFLCSGGRFAGGLFVDNVCVRHKATSRYVVRAKQGGSQMSHDKKGAKQCVVDI